MTFPEDTLPLDITIPHQIRMISEKSDSIQTVIVDNRPPWMYTESRQQQILDELQKTRLADVLRVDYKVYDDPKYLQRFFRTGDPTNSTKSIERAHDRSDISGEHMSSNSQGMFTFLEHCLAAEAAVDMCIYLDPDIIVYRNGSGMVELAREIYRAHPEVIALNPPTMCGWYKMSALPEDEQKCAMMRAGLLSQRYLILNRARLEKALPLRVPHEEFNVNFEHLFHEGMRRQGFNAAKRMVCANTFAIHPFSSRWAHCRNKRENLNIERHSKLIAEGLGFTHEKKYYTFDGTMVEGLQELLRRVERGQLPQPVDPASVTNMCEDMCPSKERLAEGLAW